jgi:potassium-dependent mechanosensitive channel
MLNCNKLLLALFLLPTAANAVAALLPDLSKAEKTTPAVKSEAKAEAIELVDIPLRIGRDQRLVQEISSRAEAYKSQTARNRELASLQSHSQVLLQQTDSASLRQLPLSGLQAQERHLQFLKRELSHWQDNLQSALVPLSDDVVQLAGLQKAWQSSLAQHGMILAPVMRQRIEQLQSKIDQAESALSEPLSNLLQMGYDAGATQNRVDRSLAQVASRIESIDRGLWKLDSEPLWQALNSPPKPEANADNALSIGLKAEFAFINEYDRVNQNRTHAVLVFSLILLPLFLWLSQQAKTSLADNTRLADYRQSLTRPISAWLLLSILFLVLLQLTGPALRLKLLLVLAWVPVMRLQPARLLKHVGYWMYLTAVFFLINLFAEAVSVHPLLFRLILLGNGLLMLIALVILLLHTSKRLKQQRTLFLLALRTLSAIATAVLAVAVIANLAGNVTLAAMLTDATLNSAYLGLFLFAVGTVMRAFSRFLLRATVEKLKAQTQHAGGLMQVVSRLFNLVLVLAWAYGTLGSFRILLPLREGLSALASVSLGFGNVSVTIGGIVVFLISVYLSFWLAKTLRGVLSEDILPNMNLPRGVANSISSLSYYALLIFGLMVALAAAGFHISQLAIVLGALSVGIGLGLQDVVKNFVSGLILMVERPVQPGDIAEVSGTIGKVREIGMRATTLTTFEGADVIVPNGMLLSEKMINWTLSSDKRRIEIALGVAYGTDPQRVLDLLLQVAEAAKGVARVPSPTVVFSGFGQSTLDFSVRAWTDNYDDAVFVRSALAVDIHSALVKAGISIPYPQRDLHIKSIAPEALKPIPGV